MPSFTIESTYRLPVFRHRTYEAATAEDACRLAIADEDWTGQKEDYENSGATYLTGIWPGVDSAYIALPWRCRPVSPRANARRRLARNRSHRRAPPAALSPLRERGHLPGCERHVDEAAQTWSLFATYDSQTCERCGADSNNLALCPGRRAWFGHRSCGT
jgi:hypothetical protein